MPDPSDRRDELDQELARLAAATSDLKPDGGFTEAVLRAARETGDPLARVARATAELEPDAAFTDAVVQAARATPTSVRPAITDGIVRAGRAAVAVAALAAAASVLLFFQTQRQVDAAIMSSVDTVEVDE